MNVRKCGATLALPLVGALLALTGCGNGTEPNKPAGTSPTIVRIVSGDGQIGHVGQPLSTPLTVEVKGSTGAPVQGATVTFAVTSGVATVSPTTVSTDPTGQAQTQVTFGSTPGNVTVSATLSGTPAVTIFSLAAGTGTAAARACATGSAQTPAAGGVLPDVGGTGICLGGGTSGADYALVAFYGNSDSSQTALFSVTSQGATPLSTANVAPVNAPTTSPMRVAARSPSNIAEAFDLKLREMARRDLTPKIPAAQAWMRSRNQPHPGVSFNTIPSSVTLNQILTLNANGTDPCANAINVGARVVAISNSAIVLADTANPTGGFTTAQYASFATTFDTLINPLDTQNFGQPTDIDHNGKIVILFTKEVNKLTPKTGAVGVVGGFFFERDLFPTSDDPTDGLQGCATSNVGEMFYVLVPDPSGVYSIPHTQTDVLNLTVGTLAHEYQHLINAGHRLYVTNASAFEDVWLNEGLSHIAEELLYYRQSHKAPRQNLTISDIASDSQSTDIFNNDQADNFGRYEVFLSQPNATSVYAGNDSLQTRGATWNLLRYLADHRTNTTNDADTWLQFDNTPLTGQDNIAHIYGSDYMTLIRNWATSVFSDDVTGVSDARFLQPSWDMRAIFPQLCANSSCSVRLNRFPLAIIPLGDNSPANVNVFAGGAAYMRFTVPAGASASIDWNSIGLPVSPLVKFTVVRTR